MQFPCELKKLGGSHYVIVNVLVLEKLNVSEGDIVLVDFKEKVKG